MKKSCSLSGHFDYEKPTNNNDVDCDKNKIDAFQQKPLPKTDRTIRIKKFLKAYYDLKKDIKFLDFNNQFIKILFIYEYMGKYLKLFKKNNRILIF